VSVGAAAALGDARPDDDVVRRARAGDVRAFESLFRAHGRAVHGIALRLLGDERDAREATQDVFVRAWERLASFRGESGFGTWLHRLAANVVLERLRTMRRDAARFSDVAPDDALARGTGGDDIHARIDLESALRRLASGPRTVFVLHDIEGYSHQEIARMMGIASGTARAQLWRARRRLMELLEG
jgi:RNA polymerase sigma-70 factor (ECF subfamily)